MVQSLQADNPSRTVFALPELLDSQRDAFNLFLKEGIAKEFSKLSPIKVEAKNILAELILDGNNYQLLLPTDNPRECILKMKTYDCKLYVKGQIIYSTFDGRVLHKTKAEWLLVGYLPLMTKRGHFIINGSPRVIVQQVVRCPGIYFQEMADKDSSKQSRFYADIIPRRGVWLRVQITKKGEIQIKFKKGKKIQAEILQRCLQVIERQEKLKSLIFAYKNLSANTKILRSTPNFDYLLRASLGVSQKLEQKQNRYDSYEISHSDNNQELGSQNKSNWVVTGLLNLLFSKDLKKAYVKKQLCLNDVCVLRKRKQAELCTEDLYFCYTYDKLYRPAEDKEREQSGIKSDNYMPTTKGEQNKVDRSNNKDKVKETGQFDSSSTKVEQNKLDPKIQFDSSFKAQKCYTNLFSTFKIGSRYDLSDLGRQKINTKFGINVSETQLTALDLQITRYWLQRYSKGEKRVDDIDHSKNRRIRTSASLLQSQFENGIERLKKFTWNKLKDFLNAQVAEAESSYFASEKLSSNMIWSKANLTAYPLSRYPVRVNSTPQTRVTTLFDNISVMPFATQSDSRGEQIGKNSQKLFHSDLGFADTLRTQGNNAGVNKHSTLSLRPNLLLSGKKKLSNINHKVRILTFSKAKDISRTQIFPDLTFEFFRKIQFNLEKKENRSIKNIVSTKPITGAFREFFGSNPLSQYMDQTNPLAEITHKRRISSLGIGGVSRDSAGMAIRGIHATHYGRICPIETPEGKNAGLVNSLSFFAKIDSNGFLKTPYYKVFKGQVQNELGLAFFSAEQETVHNFYIAPSDLQKSSNNILQNNLVAVRVADNLLDLFKKIHPYAVDCIGISPIQMISVATSLIPFLEHNDANRALMGSNMQRQAVPLMIPERPLIGTGLESLVLAESGHITQSKMTGFISYVSCNEILIESLKNTNKSSHHLITRALNSNTTHVVKDTLNRKSPFGSARVRYPGNTVAFATRSGESKKVLNSEQRLIKQEIVRFKTHVNSSQINSLQNKLVNKNVQPLFLKKLPLICLQTKQNIKSKLNFCKTTFIRCNDISKIANNNPTAIQRNKQNDSNFVFSLKSGQKKHQYENNRKVNSLKTRLNRIDWNKKGFHRIAYSTTFPQANLVDLFNTPINDNIWNKVVSRKPNQLSNRVKNKVWIQRSLALSKQRFGHRDVIYAEKMRSTYGMHIMPRYSQKDLLINGKEIEIKAHVKQKIQLNCSILKNPAELFLRSGETNNILLRSYDQTINKATDSSATNVAQNKLAYSGQFDSSVPIFTTHSLYSRHTNKTFEYSESKLHSFSHIIQNFNRSNQDICLVERALVKEGDWVQQGDILTDCSASDQGELAVGKNVLIAYLPWEGFNFEDAIVISDRLVKEQVYTSLHIERYDFDAQDFKEGNEWFTNDLPGIASKNVKHLNEFGLPKIGSFVKEGDILVGKIKYSNKKATTPYERLLCDILGEKNFAARDASLYIPRGVEARVIHHQLIGFFERNTKEQKYTAANTNHTHNTNAPVLTTKNRLPKVVNVFLGEKRAIQVGDKMSGRHGNKGVVSTILPRQDMPYLADGTPIDIILNPLGVPSRMNVGQVFECLLGLAATYLKQQFKITPFDEIYGIEASQSLVYLKLYQARLQSGQNWLFQVDFPGKTRLIDGRSGEAFDQWVTVGKAYMLKLIHMVNEKIHARSTGPYALITQQPLRGRSQKGGQRLGEMEVWALQGFGAAYTLQELLTKKSDDSIGRKDIAASILPRPVSILDTIQGSANAPSNRTLGFYENESKKKTLLLGQPDIFKVLVCELQALCLDVGLYTLTNQSFQRDFITTL